jgi:hypothetical protein
MRNDRLVMLGFQLDVGSLVNLAFRIQLLKCPKEHKLDSNDDAKYLAKVQSTAVVSI